MAKGKIAGITVEIGGDTTKLDKALSGVNSQTRDLQGELKGVETLLKMDPSNVQLIAQKQEILNATIDQTREKLDILKTAQSQVQNQFDKGEITAEQYRDFQRELISTEQKLGRLENQAAEFNATGGKVDTVAKNIKDVGDEAEKSGTSSLKLGDIIKGNLISEAVIGGVRALGAAFKGVYNGIKDAITGSLDYAGTVSDAAQKTGMNVEELQKYQYAAKMSGMETETLEKAMIKSQKSFADAKTGSKGLKDAYKALGVDISKISNSGDAFDASLKALTNIKDETTRNALANDLFGKSYADLAPLLNEGADGIEDLKNKAAELGIVMDEDAISSGEALGDTLDTLKLQGEGLVNNMVSMLLPGLSSLATDGSAYMQEFTSAISEADGDFGQIGEVIGQALEDLIAKIMENMPKLLTAGFEIISSLMNGIISNLPAMAAMALDIIQRLAFELIASLPMIIQAGLDVILSLAKGITESLPTLIPLTVDTLLLIVDSLIENIDLLIDASIAIVMALADGLITAMPALLAKAPVIISKLVEAIARNLPKIIQAATQIIVQLALGLVTALPQLIAQIPTMISAIGQAFKSFNWGTIGQAIIDGIKNGVKNAAAGLINAAKEVAAAALNGLKKFLGIHSPSTKFRDEIGKMIPQGMAIGVKADTSKAIAAMADLTTQVMDAGTPDMINMMNGNPLVTPSSQLAGLQSSLSDNGSLAAKIEAMTAILATYLPRLDAEPQLVMDTGALVGSIKHDLNRQLGKESARRERGI